jgi:transposase
MVDGTERVEGGCGLRRHWTTAEKRRIVEQTLSSSVSVATVARQHGVNANQVFYWRKLYHIGQLGVPKHSVESSVQLLPVSVEDSKPSGSALKRSENSASSVTINIEIAGRALVSLEGAVDAAIVRAVLESLRG